MVLKANKQDQGSRRYSLMPIQLEAVVSKDFLVLPVSQVHGLIETYLTHDMAVAR